MSNATPSPCERRRDVGEQDRGVDAEPAHRLESDLGAQRRVAGDLDERGVLADRPELRQRAAGLAHEPDGRRVDGLATRRRGGSGRRAGRLGDPAVPGRDRVVASVTPGTPSRAAATVSAMTSRAVRERDEPRLELRRREKHAGIEHRPEEARERVAVGLAGLGVIAWRRAAEEDRQQRADPADRDVATRLGGGLAQARLEGRRRRLEIVVSLRPRVRASVATPAAIVSGCPDSVPAW